MPPEDPQSGSTPTRGAVAAASLAGGLGLLGGAALLPPLFSRLFALDPPDPRAGSVGLWIAAGLVLALSVAVLLLRRRAVAPRVALPLLGLLALLGLELGVRLVATSTLISEALHRRLQDAGQLASAGSGYLPHPFVQYTGNPAHTRYNHLGFQGGRWRYRKAPGLVRVACLGGSTTASGYPALMQRYLNSRGAPRRFEVLNFAMEGWTSAHSLVTFVLTALDFAPDYVVVHHGWNDNGFCRGACPRGDYSHVILPLSQVQISPLERLLVGHLVTYRWLALESLVQRGGHHRHPDSAPGGCADSPCRGTDDLYAFGRNLRTLIQVAEARGIRVLLATLPHATGSAAQENPLLAHLGRANRLMRALAGEGAGALLVDLDRMMTGALQGEFTDLGHMTARGRQHKARRVGAAILSDLDVRGR